MTEEKLFRGISRWDLTAIVINTVIGAGIFGLPSKVAALIGSYSIIAFIFCSIIIGFVVLCFAEVSSRFRTTGGAYAYTNEAFGGFAGFEIGWLFWVTRLTAFAANCNLMISYMGFFYEPISTGALRVFSITLIVFGLMWLNITGVKGTANATSILTIGKLLPLSLFIIIGIFFIDPANFDFSVTPESDAFSAAILTLIYAFVGFESAVVPAGEVKNPEKNVPFALLTAIGIIVAFYILIQVVSIGTLPGLAESERPLADAAETFVGPIGASVIVIGALISILGNLNVGLLATSRLLYAIAENGDLPSFLAKTNSKFKTPAIAIAVTSILSFGFTVMSSFIAALTFSTVTRLLVYGATCLALPIFRNREDAPKAGFTAPFGIAASVISIGLLVWLLWSVKFVDHMQLLAAILVGAGVYALTKIVNRLIGEGKTG